MTLEGILEARFESAVEINVTFNDKQYLENVFNNLLGKEITGYKISENETNYIWDNKVEKKKNYCASTIVPIEQVKTIASYFYREIKKKWEIPLIQLMPCLLNQDFNAYLENAVARI